MEQISDSLYFFMSDVLSRVPYNRLEQNDLLDTAAKFATMILRDHQKNNLSTPLQGDDSFAQAIEALTIYQQNEAEVQEIFGPNSLYQNRRGLKVEETAKEKYEYYLNKISNHQLKSQILFISQMLLQGVSQKLAIDFNMNDLFPQNISAAEKLDVMMKAASILMASSKVLEENEEREQIVQTMSHTQCALMELEIELLKKQLSSEELQQRQEEIDSLTKTIAEYRNNFADDLGDRCQQITDSMTREEFVTILSQFQKEKTGDINFEEKENVVRYILANAPKEIILSMVDLAKDIDARVEGDVMRGLFTEIDEKTKGSNNIVWEALQKISQVFLYLANQLGIIKQPNDLSKNHQENENLTKEQKVRDFCQAIVTKAKEQNYQQELEGNERILKMLDNIKDQTKDQIKEIGSFVNLISSSQNNSHGHSRD